MVETEADNNIKPINGEISESRTFPKHKKVYQDFKFCE